MDMMTCKHEQTKVRTYQRTWRSRRGWRICWCVRCGYVLSRSREVG